MPRVLAFALVIPLLALGFLPTGPAFAKAAGPGEAPRVRVLLREGLPFAPLKGASLAIRGEGGRTVAAGVSLAAFAFSGGEMVLRGSGVRGARFEVRSSDGFLELGGAPLRGRLLLTALPAGITAVASVPLDAYLVALANGEVSSAWPPEAVRAQVIAARTYALGRMARGAPLFDVRADTGSQVYPGVFSEDTAAARAVAATRGQALYRGEELLDAVYHSTCGGTTVSAGEAWGKEDPALPGGVRCGDCGESPQAVWEVELSRPEVSAAVARIWPGGPPGESVTALSVRTLTPGRRAATLAAVTGAGTLLVPAADFRREVGAVRLPSTWFTVRAQGERFLFSGRGYGHGVGMCQWGARGAALRGLTAPEILLRYYPGAELRQAY